MDDQTNQVGAGPGEAERAQEPGAIALGRGGRMSRQRKSAVVLWLLRGEDLETVSRELGVTAAALTGWRDAFLAAGEAALTTRAITGEERANERRPSSEHEITGHCSVAVQQYDSGTCSALDVM